MLSEIHIKALQ